MTRQDEQIVLNEIEKYILHLISCSLNGGIPREKPEVCNWSEIVKLLEHNSVLNAVSPAVKRYPYEITPEIRKKIEAALQKTVYRLLHFQVEREAVFSAMEEKGIAYLPLKGINLAEYYLIPGMRWMCDNDILYGNMENCEASDETAETLKNIMIGLGYTTEHLGLVHDVYYKKPFFNFEMHRKLFSADSPFAGYYANPWKRAIPVSGKKCQYCFKPEDEYVFMLAHAYKHFQQSGSGIRTLVDEYAFLHANTKMDWQYIKEQLLSIGLETFEENIREAAINAFSLEGSLTEKNWEMIRYMFNCGTYGKLSIRVQNTMKRVQQEYQLEWKDVRKKYMKERFWAKEDMIKEFYPFFYRHRSIRWFLPFFRIMKGLIIHPGKLYMEWKSMKESK